jgi:ribonuclease-3
MAASPPSSADLEARLGHRFAEPALLTRALTHASRSSVLSNERLEFLGDRVLGLVVAEKLHALYPDDPEGVLALKLNALVRGEACARAAEQAGLADHLILASAEAGSGGRKKTAILAGAIEAVIAALYLDGGYDAARSFVERYWTDAFENLGAELRDPKTALQEWSQGPGGQSLPVYKQIGREGPDHAPRFAVTVTVEGHAPKTGFGGSKREAEQDAARRMLEELGLL